MPPTFDWLKAAAPVLDEISELPLIRLVDVGNAGAAHPGHLRLAPYSSYLGFDPDQRITPSAEGSAFQQKNILPYAVTARDTATAEFHLTEYPECSSILEPNLPAARRYSIGNFFKKTGQKSAPAITLNRALKEAKLSGIDWLKLDSQGTDLDLLQSLEPTVLNSLYRVDVEPGVSPFYHGENGLGAMHEFMLQHGFWLADLSLQKFPRISPDSLNELKLSEKEMAGLKKNPFAVELSYIRAELPRTDESISSATLISSWLIAMADGQTSHALQLLSETNPTELGASIKQELIRITRVETQRGAPDRPENRSRRILRLLTPPIIPKLWNRLRR
ncbi:MAG: hypothetical protein SynsKO_39320 [Synoicihabitans sp.]